MAKTRSTPIEIPTHGICLPDGENIPTKSSYLPPAAIDPTPEVSSPAVFRLEKLSYKLHEEYWKDWK